MFKAPVARVAGVKAPRTRHVSSRISELQLANESSCKLDHMYQFKLWPARRAVQVKTGLKARAGLSKVGRGPARAIARGRYHSNDSFSK